MIDRVAELSSTETHLLNELITAFMTSQAITVSARLGIADALDKVKKAAAELAIPLNAHAPFLAAVTSRARGFLPKAQRVKPGRRHSPYGWLMRASRGTS